MLKEEYVTAVEAAGFRDVKLLKETPFSLDCIQNDPSAQAIIADLEISGETLKEFEGSLVSIQLTGVKR